MVDCPLQNIAASKYVRTSLMKLITFLMFVIIFKKFLTCKSRPFAFSAI